jgi:hypothetical protein
MKLLQNTLHSVLIIYKNYALVFHQAFEAPGGFLIMDQLQLAYILY